MIDEIDRCSADHHCPSARVVLADLARAATDYDDLLSVPPACPVAAAAAK